MKLFDIITLIIFDYRGYKEKVSTMHKKQNAFILNRLMSIAFPLHANYYNHKEIAIEFIVDIWAYTLSKKCYKEIPKWCKSLGTTINKDEFEIYSKDAVKLFLKENHITINDFESAKKLLPEFIHEQLKFYEKQIALINNKKLLIYDN